MTDFLLPANEVIRRVGLSRPTILRWVNAKRFPAPLKLETGIIRWLESDVTSWIEKQAEGPRVTSYKMDGQARKAR